LIDLDSSIAEPDPAEDIGMPELRLQVTDLEVESESNLEDLFNRDRRLHQGGVIVRPFTKEHLGVLLDHLFAQVWNLVLHNGDTPIQEASP